ncbi:hypothetical protein [Lysobacter tyrosinilyticus]
MNVPISRALLTTALIAASGAAWAQASYRVEELESPAGASARGSSINNLGLVSGYSTVEDTTHTPNALRHATAWFQGQTLDLGTLGHPGTSNSTVAWPVKNLNGRIVGISQTNARDPNDELWSCFYFFSGPYASNGKTCRGFVWEKGHMRPLPPLEGGHHSFAAGANNAGEVIGWAENGVVDPKCEAPQKLQFRPVIWGPREDQMRALPLIGDDTSGAATAINDSGQAAGISGICDMAVGRYSAAHAVVWDHGQVIELKGFAAPYWNTPNAMNQRGDVVGFMGTPGDPNADRRKAFVWFKGSEAIAEILPLQGDVYASAQGINEARQVVGMSCKEAGVGCRAFLWEGGVTQDISHQPGYSGTLTSAIDINDFGAVTGRAVGATGARKAFVATPISP